MSRQHGYWLSVLIVFFPYFPVPAEEEPLESPRIEFYRKNLPEKSQGVGPTITDRAAWQAIARWPAFTDVVKKAEAALKRPLPELTDDLYLDYSRTGNRSRYQGAFGKRYGRFTQLIYAECLENRGRFLPAIERIIDELCEMKTWVWPAHDRNLENFKGQVRQIDLRSSAISWELATAAYWLGEKLSPAVRTRLAKNLELRTFTPWESYLQTGKPSMFWPQATHNWNAVCLAGVTGAALANIESRDRRARLAAAAEKYIENFLAGFAPDGYCSEGIGYWNYGFGHYLMLAETLRRATGGKIDWLNQSRLRPIAMYGVRMEILPGTYPAFADCHISPRPDAVFMGLLNRRLDLGLPQWEALGDQEAQSPQMDLPAFGLFGFSATGSKPPVPTGKSSQPPLRDWFADAGILICRPAAGGKNGLGAALKGGHNAEHHNHNDVGSFVVARGHSTPLVDPGSEVYTARTFGKKRYQSAVLNSFGHSVPRVGGVLQSPGKQARAKVLRTDFTAVQDTLVLDISSAYNLPALKKLQRTFVFSREGMGKLTVIDEVEYDGPQTFDTALVTFGPWKQVDATHLLVGKSPDAVRVEIIVEGGDFRIDPQEINEDLPGSPGVPIRLSIELKQPVTKAKVTTVIMPAE